MLLLLHHHSSYSHAATDDCFLLALDFPFALVFLMLSHLPFISTHRYGSIIQMESEKMVVEETVSGGLGWGEKK